MENMITREDLHAELDAFKKDIRIEVLEKISDFSKTMYGLIISIWVVTLITASSLYLVTH